MSRVKRKARKATRIAKRTVRKTARVEKRTVRKATRVAKRVARKAPARPTPVGLADLTNAPGMKQAAGGPSLNEISQGQDYPLDEQQQQAPETGGLSGIQNDPFKAAEQPGDFGSPDPNAGYEPSEEEEPQEVEAVEESGEDFSDIIGGIIGGVGNAVGGILKGLNINTGARKKAKADQAIQAYQARAAATLAASGSGTKKSNTGLYIGIGAAALILIIVVFFVMKKKR
jgi:hypothetical protein